MRPIRQVVGNTALLQEFIPPPSPTPSIPAAPKDFRAVISCHLEGNPILYNAAHVTLTWTDVATNEEGYRVFRNGDRLATLGANENSFTDDTNQPAFILQGQDPPRIKYRMEAHNGSGKSDREEKTVSCWD